MNAKLLKAFESYSFLIIPKSNMARRSITVTSNGLKLLGYPTVVDDNRYPRNQFIFNICFVLHPWSRSIHLERALNNLVENLIQVEKDTQFLSNPEYTSEVEDMLDKIIRDYKETGECRLMIKEYLIATKVMWSYFKSAPPAVNDWDVPFRIVSEASIKRVIDSDLTAKQIMGYINSDRTVVRIAEVSNVHVDLVKECLRNLAYFGVIKLLPLFKFSNIYAHTHNPHAVLNLTPRNKEKMIQHGSYFKDKPITARMGLQFFIDLNHNVTVGEVAGRQDIRNTGLMPVYLINWFLMGGSIRRVHRYILWKGRDDPTLKPPNNFSRAMLEQFDGNKCLDEIITMFETYPQPILDMVMDYRQQFKVFLK